jgi:hypothetical protein
MPQLIRAELRAKRFRGEVEALLPRSSDVSSKFKAGRRVVERWTWNVEPPSSRRLVERSTLRE